jgi:SsrA-binding protein
MTYDIMSETIITTNKRAYHDYEILERYQAGIKLTGAEAKSVKLGQANLKGAYATISAVGTPLLIGCHIAPYKPAAGAQTNYDPTRSRALLLSKKEIKTLIGKLKEKRYALIPLSLHNKYGLIKVELGLARGKKQYEKREAIKKKDIEREIGRRL